MKLSVLMVINAIVALVFGIGFVLMPAQVVSMYGVTASEPLKLTAQLLGAALIGFGVLTWFARKATESDARKAILLAFFISDGIGFIVSLIAQLGSVVNALGWMNVGIYLLLALGFGYFRFMKPASA